MGTQKQTKDTFKIKEVIIELKGEEADRHFEEVKDWFYDILYTQNYRKEDENKL
ncbi:hypothetical protein ACU3L3_07600 [Priestia endophytica]